MTIAQTAAEAYDRYNFALANNLLIQRDWHRDSDGRHLACALGVIGDEVNCPSDCPAQIMPRWLAQMTVWFFDRQSFDDAKDWGARFYAELKRLNGAVPFSVIHDWQANVVGPLAIEVATMRKRDVAAHEALQAMQLRALSGEKITADEWRPILKAAFFDANANANANAYAHAYAEANAHAYAEANAHAYAEAKAHAYAYAHAYAEANAHAYAEANAHAYAEAKNQSVKRLADGMVECLSRAKVLS